MNADDVIALRREWEQWNFAQFLPEATVMASADWTRYVRAMAAQIPRDQERITYPTEEEAAWAWPEGVVIVLEEPFELEHTIISTGAGLRGTIPHAPRLEMQLLSGIVFGIGQELRTSNQYGEFLSETLFAIPIMFIGGDPSDLITAQWVPGGVSLVRYEDGGKAMMAKSTAFVLSLITALGHRVTLVGEPAFAGRGERRRVQRELPSLRVLSLASHASVSRREAPGRVEWSHRWIVRGHWHTVSYGPRQTLKRLQWYDSFIKGPEDKPLDDRATVWKAE